MRHADGCELNYDRELGECTCDVRFARRAAELEATIADLRAEVETLKMLLPPVGSITFPPGCDEYPDARLVADLRDRLRIMAPRVCEGCGCATADAGSLCSDCDSVFSSCFTPGQSTEAARAYFVACISVGLRALCGRRILEGC